MRSSSTTAAALWIPAVPSAAYPPNALRPNAWASPDTMTATFLHPLTGFIEKTFVITEFELRKLRHDFTELITRALQPALSLIIACIVKTRERFMGVGQVLTMPLFFASNAIYPTDIMPGWLKTVSHLNPLTYVVDALRTFMLAGSTSTFGLSRDYEVILLTTTLLVFIGARLYPRLAT